MNRTAPSPEEADAIPPERVRDLVAASLLGGGDEAVYVLDRNWRYVYLTEAAVRLKNRTREDLLGRSMWDVFPEAAGTLAEREYRRAFAEGVPVAFELAYGPRNRWFEVRARPAEDFLVVRFRDITRRKEAEAALRETDERFRLAADATSDVLWDYDFTQDRLWVSDNFSRLFGDPPHETGTTFRSWAERVHPEDRERTVNAARDAIRERRPRLSREYRFRTRDGSYLHVLDRMRLLYDDAGRARRAVGVMVDITGQKAAEERQRFLVRAGEVLTSSLDYRQRLRDFARMAAGPLADFCVLDMVDEDGRIRRIEAASSDPGREALVRELLRFPPALPREEGVAKALRTGEPVLVERVTDELLRRIAQSDEHFRIIRALAPHSFLIVPLRARGRTLGAVALVITTPGRRFGPHDLVLAQDLARQAALDIDNARLHRDAERARKAAEAANQAKTRFLNVLGHDLRMPLTAIVTFAELIEAGSSGPVSPRQKEQLARIKASAWHVTALVDEILDYARVEAGREPLRLEQADAAELARELADLLIPEAKTKGLALECTLPHEPVVLRTDPVKLRRILSNLLGNAIKFTERGSVALELRPGDGVVDLCVRDTGPGIPPEDRDRIFEAFVQGGTAAPGTARPPAPGGAGLGLAISRSLARMLGGDVLVESVPGRGSTFTLRLPVASGG